MKERLELEQVVSIGKAAARKLTHARILLLADARCGEAYADAEIVPALGTSPRTIERLRQRCVTEGLKAALDHRPQPPRPDKVKIKGNVAQTLLELACSDPPRGRCHWTLQLLADELVVLGLLDTISTVTVWQALKKMTSSRGSSRPGVSPPKADAAFVWRMEDVLQTSRLPYDPRYPVVCFDEACKQLCGEVRPAQRTRRGRAARIDYE